MKHRPQLHRRAPALVAPTPQQRADQLTRDGRLTDAWKICQTGMAAAPADAGWLPRMALILLKSGRIAEAETVYADAVDRLEPDAALLNGWGICLKLLGHLQAAERAFRWGLQFAPADAALRANLAAALRALERLDEAEAELALVLQQHPDQVNAHVNLAAVRLARHDFPGAVQAARQALARQPDQPDALYTLTGALQAQGDMAEAAQLIDDSLKRRPTPRMLFCKSMLDLTQGALSTGWAAYEARFQAEPARFPAAPPFARWHGEPLAGRQLLIWREQGLGDELLFATCYGDAIALATGDTLLPSASPSRSPVRIQCDPRLTSLFSRAFPDAEVGDTRPAPGEAGIVQVAAGSLPGLLRPGLDRFGATGGFLSARADLKALWSHHVAALGPGLKVGLCWRSGLRVEGRRDLYTDLVDWKPLLTLPGLHIVPLHYDDVDAEIAEAEQGGTIRLHRWPDLDLKDDLESVAALLANLDLVVTVPTAAGELAAALGVMVWRLSPRIDFTRLGTSVRPWFASMRPFLESASGDRRDTIQAIARTLDRLRHDPAKGILE